MSSALYRIGRFAARRPLTVIVSWVAVAAIVVATGAAFGQKLGDSFTAPGLESR